MSGLGYTLCSCVGRWYTSLRIGVSAGGTREVGIGVISGTLVVGTGTAFVSVANN